VPGTDLEILSHDVSAGVLTFKFSKTIPTGQMWSGVLTVLRFKAKVTGSTTIVFEHLGVQ